MKSWLKFAILIDMPLDIFWNDTPSFVVEFYEVYREKQKIKNQDKVTEMQFLAWQTGMYVRDSIISTVGNMFGKNKNKYPEIPYGMENKLPKQKDLTDEEKNNKLLQQNYLEMLKWGEFHKGKHLTEDSV